MERGIEEMIAFIVERVTKRGLPVGLEELPIEDRFSEWLDDLDDMCEECEIYQAHCDIFADRLREKLGELDDEDIEELYTRLLAEEL